MLTGELRSKIDNVWNAFWAGGIANPLEVIEQITYLLFMRGLDDAHTLEENKANRLGKPMERRIFPKGKDGIGKNGGVAYPPRQIGGFYKRDELELAIQRRTGRKPLADTPVNGKIVERPYQHRAIRNVVRSFEKDNDRKALLVMATGSGKTRTVIALVDLLMRAGWVKRVLFLADRVALVNQAAAAFKAHLPDSAPVNLVTERTTDGRVFLSTYPTMMNLIDGRQEGRAKFGPGHFDLIVIDEAHRSVYQRFRAIFEYFDGFLVGLTATPKDEVDKNTYSLFDLEDGVPTDVPIRSTRQSPMAS
jgi:type I restriction enzyme, R subunit